MLAILSPAKTLDFDGPLLTEIHSQPDFLSEADELIQSLRGYGEPELEVLMEISPKLAALNAQRYRDWHTPFSLDNARAALLAFKGDVYNGFALESFEEDDFRYAQSHLRILSGLFGLLKPMDLIQPYRLEMGTPLANSSGKDLYEFWRERLTAKLEEDVEGSGTRVLVNLASKEYSQAIDLDALGAEVITPMFKDWKNGTFRFITIFGKQARGAMADYLVRNRVEDLEALRAFDGMGYAFDPELSEGDRWVFTRRQDAE